MLLTILKLLHTAARVKRIMSLFNIRHIKRILLVNAENNDFTPKHLHVWWQINTNETICETEK